MKLHECIHVLTDGKKITRKFKDYNYIISILDFCCLCEYTVEGILITRPWVVERSDLEAEDWEILS